jgi:dTDP-4-dehydrorhamnose 3,5-epimerase
VPGAEGGLNYRDPRLALNWPLPVEEISPKDAAWKLLGEVEPALRQRMTLGSADSRLLSGSVAGEMAGRTS